MHVTPFRVETNIISLPSENNNNLDFPQIIHEWVVRYLHPYISGQKTRNEDLYRKPLVDLLLEKEPKLLSLPKDEVQNMAFDSYLKTAALGLYVYLKKKKKFIKPASSKFTHLVNALAESLPIDFPEKKLKGDEITKIASGVLESINTEKYRLDMEAKIPNRKGNANLRWIKFGNLLKSGDLFLEPIAKVVQEKAGDSNKAISDRVQEQKIFADINPLENKLKKILEQAEEFDHKTLSSQINKLELKFPLQNVVEMSGHLQILPAFDIQNAFQTRLLVGKSLLSIIDIMDSFQQDNSKMGERLEDLQTIRGELVSSYTNYVKGQKIEPNFLYYVINVLNLLNLIEKLSQLKLSLKSLGIASEIIDEKILELETQQWITLYYTNSSDNHELIQNSTRSHIERCHGLVEVGNLISLQANFLKNKGMQRMVENLMETCLQNDQISSLDILARFKSILE